MNSHLVQFYDQEASLLDEAARFVEGAQLAGEPVVMFLTADRLQQLDRLLDRRRSDQAIPAEKAPFVGIDADQTVAWIATEDVPDEARFIQRVGGLLAQVRAGSGTTVRIFTEMAATLCAAGKGRSAVLLEQFWSRLATRQPLRLQCVYPLSALAANQPADLIEAICAPHSQVLPCGVSGASTEDADSLRGTIARLEHRVASLEVDLAGYRDAGEVAEKARRDMAALAQAYTELERVANVDPLTGLYNRRVFLDRLEHALERAKRRRNSFALLLVDLDDFKSVNDRLGHEAGDRLLREVAVRLGLCARGSDTVCRLGGDEFTVIMEDCSLAEAALVAQRIVETLDKEMTIEGESVLPAASVGVGVYPDDADSAAALIRSADQAMYRAKGHGKGRYEDSRPAPLR